MGYGRRLRFLVLDRAHGDKLIGLIDLADPVFALAARDRWIGWDVETRTHALTNVMDAFVLGAVPPYSTLRAGKLVALLATSRVVRDTFRIRYAHRTTLISERDPCAQLALVTTTSALGRSSIYNRLTGPGGVLAYRPVGYTVGTGDFHLSGAIHADLARFVAQHRGEAEVHAHERWRAQPSPRNRREVLHRALSLLGLPARQLRFHGVHRQVFVAPLMHNAVDHLLTGADPHWTAVTVEETTAHCKARGAPPLAPRRRLAQVRPAELAAVLARLALRRARRSYHHLPIR